MTDDGTALLTIGEPARTTGLDRLTAAADVRIARYRRLSAVVNGLEPASAYEQEFGRVVAALRAHPDR